MAVEERARDAAREHSRESLVVRLRLPIADHFVAFDESGEGMNDLSRQLSNFSLYEQRAYRMFEKSHDRLLMMQEQRRQKEAAQMIEAQRLLALHEAEQEEKREAREQQAEIAAQSGEPSPAPYIPEPYEPSKDGFVLQLPEIIADRDRKERLQRAWQLPTYRTAAA